MPQPAPQKRTDNESVLAETGESILFLGRHLQLEQVIQRTRVVFAVTSDASLKFKVPIGQVWFEKYLRIAERGQVMPPIGFGRIDGRPVQFHFAVRVGQISRAIKSARLDRRPGGVTVGLKNRPEPDLFEVFRRRLPVCPVR